MIALLAVAFAQDACVPEADYLEVVGDAEALEAALTTCDRQKVELRDLVTEANTSLARTTQQLTADLATAAQSQVASEQRLVRVRRQRNAAIGISLASMGTLALIVGTALR